ncbi:glycosyl hydrolase family 43 protein [Diplodia corticola]|uniref:Glycosyl hydrolase family 43 protein n=1 Tax=Diplodia corticola TaxID=236234 RepID=A0A1J9QP64_9PEZI|nr:glycosyl hydrolase family 43 protein [Diplodia corticola]OJD30241.1 glycosyl hydrolase family 43 protein [Diplodia corticola]
MRTPSLVSLALVSSSAFASLQVIPGATWTATNTGEHIQAHGAGIIKVDDTYYLIGEDKTNGTAFLNVNCYSSTNLVEWTYEGALLSQEASGDLGPSRVVERPKVIYNDETSKYVLWMHIDSSDYKEAKTGVATGDTVCGSYEYQGSFQPLGFQSRDMGLFKDDDGSAYLLTEDRENGLRINALTSDYLNVTGDSSVYRFDEKYEAPAVVKANGTYFLFASQLSGWDPNDNYYTTATSLSGPWTSWRTFAPAGSKTYSSQTTFVLPLTGTSGTAYVYLGDRWVSSALFRSTYVWLPLSLDGSAATASMSDSVNWIPDVGAGTTSPGPGESQPEGEAATLAGGAQVVSCAGCSGGQAAGYIGGTSAPGGSVTFSAIAVDAAEGKTTVRVKYQNLDAAARYASVVVNGGAGQTVAFLPTVQGTVGSSVVHVQLEGGSGNEVVIEGVAEGGWGPDVDRIMVPRS